MGVVLFYFKGGQLAILKSARKEKLYTHRNKPAVFSLFTVQKERFRTIIILKPLMNKGDSFISLPCITSCDNQRVAGLITGVIDSAYLMTSH